ncbi:MAG: hypothetical protein FJ404_15380 [Verrucomicrobia bacterium]|nr:hypothetical protein [Verrucomicrobiota bacterium]
MNSKSLFTIALLLAATLIPLQAGPKEDALAAAKRLTEKGYAWKTSSENAGGGGGGGGGRGGRRGFGASEGKIAADGTASVTVPGREANTEAVIKGDKFAIKRAEGWQNAADLEANADQGGGGGRGRFGTMMFRNFKAPAARAQDLLGQTKELKAEEGVISGELTEEGAKSLMAFGGRGGGGGPEINGAKGSVKLWIKDGVLLKMETKVQGKMSFNGNDIDIDRTSTTEFKDVGTTQVTIPEEAKKKLS